MAARPVVSYLLVGAAGGQYLAGRSLGDLLQVVGALRRRSSRSGQRKPTVAGVHDKIEVLGRNQLTKLLELGHADRLRLGGFDLSVHRHEVTQLFPRRKLSGCAVAREENEDSIVLLDPVWIRHLISDRPHDSLAGRVFVQELDYVALLEPVLTGQNLFDGVRVINAIT